MKTIIVPVDFSHQSENALKLAAKLAGENKGEIIVLHMLELNYAMISSAESFHPEQMVLMIKGAEKRLGEFLDKPYLKDVKITPVIKHYKVFSEVNEVVKQHNADLIVMGSHGSDGLKELFFGSNAEKVVRNAEVPVLVVKKDRPDFQVDTFVFACDFREESLEVFQKAQEIAGMFGASFRPVYINIPGDSFMSTGEINRQIAKFLDKANAGLEVDIYNDYSVERGVLAYCEALGADLIGVPTHGRRGLSHFFMGSIGEDIANHSSIPVLTFRM
ncbi:universal stress protein [Robiginitalea sp. SC105]|uniref:universal stress protein n=1 Tax=Robiginitalea sp. SC105 TaxID=2762332 RepID=UPI00163B5D31|nr:universal stress protein [Robiginitalea sp. SC105]MBC2838650.1 universal stress protein [Robiginitalea sp. SC105]